MKGFINGMIKLDHTLTKLLGNFLCEYNLSLLGQYGLDKLQAVDIENSNVVARFATALANLC